MNDNKIANVYRQPQGLDEKRHKKNKKLHTDIHISFCGSRLKCKISIYQVDIANAILKLEK